MGSRGLGVWQQAYTEPACFFSPSVRLLIHHSVKTLPKGGSKPCPIHQSRAKELVGE